MTKRVIALSDAHGDRRGLQEAIELAQSMGKVDVAVYLGDGVRDFYSVQPLLTEKGTQCHIVAGNNDWSCDEQQEVLFRVGRVAFFACHGHTRYVKYGLERLYYAAREREAEVALYGHTHVPKIDIEWGMYMVNPGAVSEQLRHGVAFAEILVEDSGAVQAQLVKRPQ